MDGFEFLLRRNPMVKVILSSPSQILLPPFSFMFFLVSDLLSLSASFLSQAFLDHSFTPKILYTASKLKKKGGGSFKIKVIIAGPSVLMKFDMENQMSLGMMMLFKFF